MAEEEQTSAVSICTACGRRATIGKYLCDHCGAPLTPHAHTDPVLGILSRGFAAHKVTTDPQKLIVVIGTWLWMVPLAVFGIALIVLGCGTVIEEFQKGGYWGLMGIPVFLLGLVIGWIAIGILFKTTRSYLRAQRTKQRSATHDESTSDDEAETVECLGCGHSFAGDSIRCPQCGWSYSESG